MGDSGIDNYGVSVPHRELGSYLSWILMSRGMRNISKATATLFIMNCVLVNIPRSPPTIEPTKKQPQSTKRTSRAFATPAKVNSVIFDPILDAKPQPDTVPAATQKS
ncbi:hypothetical protein Y032_0291g1567 [Ancylostoma ceylanicum]|uniref:Uncharacterized protein n=1 Tax=Ancylostoma ceylanicum TaxID=53326 RepID=A0A016S520_9BILA|nr:hypothetical protein Y032_0291g1567 [Ancylostoma ceylanicum]